MNNSSNKQVLLSVIGIAILVVSIIGVSFAFFTYSRTGSSNNLINTGTVLFTFADGDTINLTNHFPIATSEGLALANTADEDNVCTFTVTGYSSANAINYSVYAVPGDAQGSKVKFRNSEVFINIKATVPDATATFTPTAIYSNANASAITNDIDGDDGLLLGTGSITSTTSKTTNFEVRMWVDASVVTVGETGTYTSEAYSNLYYSMKIKVVVAE